MGQKSSFNYSLDGPLTIRDAGLIIRDPINDAIPLIKSDSRWAPLKSLLLSSILPRLALVIETIPLKEHRVYRVTDKSDVSSSSPPTGTIGVIGHGEFVR